MALTLPSNGHCVFAGAPGAAESVARVLDEPVDLTAQSLSALAASPPAPELLATRTRNLEALSEFGDAGTRLIRVALDDPRVEAFAVQSSGGPGARSALLTDDNVAAGGWRLGRGLHLFELAGSASPRHLVHLDPCAGDVEGEGASLARAIDARGRPEAAYLVVSSDSATCGQSLEPIFADLGLEAWTEIGLREPYVALIGASRGGVPIELRGDALTALRVEFTPARASGVAGGLPVDGT